MEIKELTVEECWHSWLENRLVDWGVLNDLQPYITPFHFVYHDHYIYSFGTIGSKDRVAATQSPGLRRSGGRCESSTLDYRHRAGSL